MLMYNRLEKIGSRLKMEGAVIMVYITGDIHGEVSRVAEMVKRWGITGRDTVVLLGDVGVNYFGDLRRDGPRKEALQCFGVPVLCIHGNHEMRPENLVGYHTAQWRGGTVYVDDQYPNLLFAKDGQVYDLEGRKALAIGGAYSVDKWYRLGWGLRWFADEQPSDQIKQQVEQNLEERNWNVDVVLSHTCPERYIPVEAFLSGIDQSSVDNSTEQWLDTIAQRLDYDAWYCGHWHINKRIDKMHFLFDGVETL
jgi:3-oxoacid CoA-transferase subunit A